MGLFSGIMITSQTRDVIIIFLLSTIHVLVWYDFNQIDFHGVFHKNEQILILKYKDFCIGHKGILIENTIFIHKMIIFSAKRRLFIVRGLWNELEKKETILTFQNMNLLKSNKQILSSLTCLLT